jgi:hypothetical protein
MDKDSVESLEQHLDALIETSRQLGKHNSENLSPLTYF